MKVIEEEEEKERMEWEHRITPDSWLISLNHILKVNSMQQPILKRNTRNTMAKC